MLVSITSIKLKSPFKFFALSYKALFIVKQLSKSDCVAQKTRGLWTLHYTMTLWENEKTMQDFVTSGAHAKAMKSAKDIAKELRFLKFEANELPPWKEAISRLEKEGKRISF